MPKVTAEEAESLWTLGGFDLSSVPFPTLLHEGVSNGL
jgi:hypothetical protein